MNSIPQKKNVLFIIILASFGYFVDIYDLVIFSIVRVKSFTEIGISGEAEMLKNTQYVLNMQMAGLLLGGIFWGIIGDKLGRVKVLFGSILIYSLSNFSAEGKYTNCSKAFQVASHPWVQKKRNPLGVWHCERLR